MRIEVALVGDPQTGLIPEVEWNRPWSDRQRVELEVEERESLASILNRASGQLHVPIPEYAKSFSAAYPFVGFGQEGSDVRVSSSLDVVDDSGRVVWNVYDFDSIPFSQVRQSVEAGTIVGDATRIFAVLQPPSGNGILVDWPTLVEGWRTAWEVLERLATVAEVAAGGEIARRVVRKLRRARESVERNRSAWTQRGGRPPDLANTLLACDWTVDRLARVLGCSDDDALVLLEAFGFREAEGLWSRGDDPESELLHAVREELDYTHHIRYDGFEPLLRERLDGLARSGERPEEEPYAPSAPELLEVTAFGYTGQVLTYQAQLGERQFAGQLPLWEIAEFSVITDLGRQVVAQELRRLAAAAAENAHPESDVETGDG